MLQNVWMLAGLFRLFSEYGQSVSKVSHSKGAHFLRSAAGAQSKPDGRCLYGEYPCFGRTFEFLQTWHQPGIGNSFIGSPWATACE
jgi:hypothetical protein